MFTLTPNLKLRVNADLTADSIYNLNRIDTVGLAVTTDSTGQIKIRSRLNILLEPDSIDINGEGLGGVINLGDTGRPILNVNVNSQNLNLVQTELNLRDSSLVFLLGLNKLTLLPPSSISTDFTLTLPDNTGQAGFNLVTDGNGVLSWAEPDPSLLTNHIEFGGVGDVRLSVDTLGLGDILASAAGLTIKSDRISNLMVAADAAISYSKLAALSFDRVLTSGATGVIETSAITPTELSQLAGVTGNIQSQINSLGGGNQFTEVWQPSDGATKVITHPLDSQSIQIQVLNISNDYATIEVSSVTRPDTDTVTLISSEAPSNNWLVLLTKVGI